MSTTHPLHFVFLCTATIQLSSWDTTIILFHFHFRIHTIARPTPQDPNIIRFPGQPKKSFIQIYMNNARSQEGPNQNTFIKLEYAKEMNIECVPIPSFCPIALFRVFCMRHLCRSFEEIRAQKIALEILRRCQLLEGDYLISIN